MSTIPKAPKFKLSKEQQRLLTQFPEEIKSWEDFLKELGYHLGSLENPSELNWESFTYNAGGHDLIFGDLTPEEVGEKGYVICGAGYTLAIQFTNNEYWPERYISDTPRYIEFAFGAKNKAFVALRGNEGELLFDKEKHFPGEKFPPPIEGTWEEIAEILIAISKEIAENLKVPEIPSN